MPSDPLYSSIRWRQLRLRILAAQPQCECGCNRATEVVDHFIPWKSGKTAAEREELKWDVNNLVARCKRSHNRKTATEDNDKAFGRWQRIPTFVKPSAAPLDIVCGPPGSGKTTYTASRMLGDTVVIDVDKIAAELSGDPLHQVDMKQWLSPTMIERNKRLGDLNKSRASNAMFIVSGSRLRDRQKWRQVLRPSRVVVMETDASLCIERINQSNRVDKRSAIAAVHKWWKQYVPSFDDSIIRSG